MKLKTRLSISFMVIVLAPFVLFGLTFMGVSKYQMGIIEKTYGVPITIESFSDSMKVIGKSTEDIFQELTETEKRNPMLLMNESYLNKINSKLREKHSYILVRNGEKIYYNGSDEDVSALFKKLPKFREFSSVSDGGSYIGQDVQAFVKQLDLEFDHKPEVKVSIFVISSAKMIIAQTQVMLRDLLFSILVILVFSALIMTVWVYTGVHRPLQKIKDGMEQIKKSNFDFEMYMDGKDEISELCRDFDEMRQRLKELDDEKKTFDNQNRELIRNISHDLKTPITAVKGYIEGIRDGIADTPEKMERYIRTIYNKANDMDRLVNELTFYSEIDTHKIPYKFNKIKVMEYFDDCAEEVELEMKEMNIAFAYINNADEKDIIIADAEQLKRVINNIIGNAVKYMDKPEKKLQLCVADNGDFIHVEIEDNGKGILNKELPYIFDRFYRTDRSRNSAQGGSGIGLSIVKKIVEDHGGRIWATSSYGEGTTLHFVIRKYQEVPVNE